MVAVARIDKHSLVKCHQLGLEAKQAQPSYLVKVLAPHVQPTGVVTQTALKHAAPPLGGAHLELLNSCVA